MLGPRLGFSKNFDNSKFNFGRETIQNELQQLEMLYSKREEVLKAYKKLSKQFNKEDASAHENSIKNIICDPFKPADSDHNYVINQKNSRKKTTVYLENELLRQFLIARNKV